MNAHHVNYPIKLIVNEMVHVDIADISDYKTKFRISWVLCRVSELSLLKMFVNSWNHYAIPSIFLLICSEIEIKQNRIENNILLTKILVKLNTRV